MKGRWSLKPGWKWVTVDEIAEVKGGGTPSTSNSSYFCEPPEGIPWITPADLSDYDSAYISHGERNLTEEGFSNSSTHSMPAGTVLFSSRAPIGYVAIAKNPITTNQGFKSLVLEDDIDPRYIRYYLISAKEYAESEASGTTFKELSGKRVKQLLVPLPPLPEQRRIADRLDAIQSRTRKTRETLSGVPNRIEEYRQSVLNAAFTGQLTADWRDDHPDVEPAEALLERILEERRDYWEKNYRAKYERKGKEPPSGWKSRYSPPDSLDRDDLPEPPESWEWVSLDQLLSNLRNGYSKAPKAEDGLPVLRISAVRPMSVDLDDVRYLAEKPDDYHKYLIEPGYLLFIRYNGNENLVGVCGRVPEIDGEYLHPDKLIRGEVAAPDLANPAFLEMALNTGDSRLHIRRRVRSTSGQSGISQDVLYSTPVPLPPEEEQKEIVRRVRQRLDKIDEMAAHVDGARERLDHLDRSVLAKAFRGELVETEAERARREDRPYETAAELLQRVRNGGQLAMGME
jgi:type I restriction enzyme S subunit